jgi:predicted transcriptional regulator
LPDYCSVEDIQYHLYVIEKVRKGLDSADSEGTVSQQEVERRLANGISSSLVSAAVEDLETVPRNTSLRTWKRRRISGEKNSHDRQELLALSFFRSHCSRVWR